MPIHEDVDTPEVREDATHRYELLPVFDPQACPFCGVGWDRGSGWSAGNDGSETRRCSKGHTVRRRPT